jgi:SAM-dependent methyltransferase
MKYHSVLSYIRQLTSFDPETWRLLPYRLRMTYRGIDLRGANPADLGLSEDRSAGHRDSGGPDLDRILKGFSISRSDSVLDIGCGKGGAMLTLAKYPFARVDGLELSPQLVRIAQHNLERMHISNATLFCCDALNFSELDHYNYFYMYNPFPEIVMRPMMDNIVSSFRRLPRKVTLIYKNPVSHGVVVSKGFQKVGQTQRRMHHPFSIYVSNPVGAPAAEECVIHG